PLTPPSERLAPACSARPKYLPGAFFDPSNISCSKRCAKPVRPGFSFLEPTWNHSLTWTIGSLRSTCRMTWSPLDRTNFSKEKVCEACAAGAALPTGFDPALVPAFRGAGVCAASARTAARNGTKAVRRILDIGAPPSHRRPGTPPAFGTGLRRRPGKV